MVRLRHQITFSIVRPLLHLYCRIVFRYRGTHGPKLAHDQPALILANHVCAWDPMFVSFNFRRAIYFIASDNIFRLGLASSIIRYLISPIPIVKSQVDLKTQRAVRETIREGGIVGLFPEGNRSFTGRTSWIFPSVGKLVRQLNCPLILFRVRGGYLSTPRWARKIRRGRIAGRVVRVMEPDELNSLSVDEINRIITDSLFVDAFADQRAGQPVVYRGKKLAESLERVLFICPHCRGIDTLTSQDDHFRCSCGLDVRYNVYGFFEPVDPWSLEQRALGAFLESVAVWDDWQRSQLVQASDDPLDDLIDWAGSRPIFLDQNQLLYDCVRGRRVALLDRGTLALYSDRLTFTGAHIQSSFRLDEIARMIVFGPQNLSFNTQDGKILEVRCQAPRSAYKYLLLHHLLLQKQKGEPRGFFGV